MSRLFRFKAFLLSLILAAAPVWADVVSLESDYVAGQAPSVDKLNNDRHGLTDGVNNVRGVYAGGVQSSGQIKADTIGEENMYDDANPRIRTNEGASCTDLVYSGLLPATSASLVLSIPAGVAYPDGYRVEKTSATAATVTASKWTYYYLLTSGSFDTNVTNIDASTPTAPSNSAILFRASSDATTINTITDLRKTSCAAGPFEAISDASGQATLDDMLAFGQPVRRFSQAGRTTQGIARGMFVSWDSHTTFTVTSGAAYINGKFRAISTDTTVTTANDAPSTGGSGLDTSSVGASTRYYVYAVADQDAVKTPSFTYSTNASAPVGVTNYRLIGSIVTDGSSLFTSRDVITAGGISEREIVGGWVTVDQATGSQVIKDSFNVSSISDGGSGLTTVTWDADFNNANYALSGMGRNTATAGYFVDYEGAPAVGSVALGHRAHDNTLTDGAYVTVIAFGDTRK